MFRSRAITGDWIKQWMKATNSWFLIRNSLATGHTLARLLVLPVLKAKQRVFKIPPRGCLLKLTNKWWVSYDSYIYYLSCSIFARRCPYAAPGGCLLSTLWLIFISLYPSQQFGVTTGKQWKVEFLYEYEYSDENGWMDEQLFNKSLFKFAHITLVAMLFAHGGNQTLISDAAHAFIAANYKMVEGRGCGRVLCPYPAILYWIVRDRVWLFFV